MNSIATAVLVGGSALVGVSAAQAQPADSPVERREVAEHVHGEAKLHIAIDANLMAIDFDAPGVDVVGFEHLPATAEEQAAVDAAVGSLNDPLPSLFDFGAAAGCTVTSAEVEFLVEEDEEGAAAAPAAPGAAEEITNHTGFEGVYEITCTDAAAIRELRIGFFERFPNSHVVEIELATGRGQTTFDVERENPIVSFVGLI